METKESGTSNVYYIALVLGVLGASFASVFIKSAESRPVVIAAWRMGISVLILLPPTLILRRDEFKKLSALDVASLSFVGVILAIHFTLWNTSLVYTSVAPSTLLVTSHPLFVALVSHFIFKERLNKMQIFGIALAFTGGTILVLRDLLDFTFTSRHFIGCALAFFGGMAAGVYYSSGRKFRKNISVLTYVTVVYLACTIALFGAALAGGLSLRPEAGSDWIWFVLLAIVPTIFGHTIHNMVLKHIRAYIVSVSLLGEPIGAAILAIIFFGTKELPTIYTLIGGVIIIIGIYLTIRGNKNEGNARKGHGKVHS